MSLAPVRHSGPRLAWIALAVASCGNTSSTSTSAESPGSSGAGGRASADAAAGGANVTVGPAFSDGGAAPKLFVTHLPAPDPPGAALTSDSATAQGVSPCAGMTLGSVLQTIRDGDPTLADIKSIYNPATATTDGNFIYAYDVGVLGFDIVFKRGLGDCPAGCTENDYQYFSTDASCRPVKVGHYHSAWGSGTCLTVEGAPLWTHPIPPDPLTICGADNSPRDLRGLYLVRAQGMRLPCAVGAVASPLGAIISFAIEQTPPDLGSGFVTFSGTGDPAVDGVPLPARFQRQRFDAALMTTYLPGACPNQSSVTARFDFEGYQPGDLEALDFGGDACTCKGAMSATLGGSS